MSATPPHPPGRWPLASPDAQSALDTLTPSGATHRNADPRFLDLNGLRYHYVDEGHGDPVVMVHGNPPWSFYYRDLIKALSDEYRFIAPDYIACALSYNRDAPAY